MARPTTTRKQRRVQVQAETPMPALRVQQPVNVRVANADAAGAGFRQLQSALMSAAPLIRENKAGRDKLAYEQGQADERMGQVDQERASREDRYAEGVYDVSVIRQTQDALSRVAERAAEEVPNDLTTEERMAAIDALARDELGPLAADPKARRLIAPRLQDFMEKVAGAELNGNLEAIENETVEALNTDIAGAIAGDSFSYDEWFTRALDITGDRTQAHALLVEAVATQIEALPDGEGVEALLELVPSKITTEDGQTIDGPRKTPRYRARLEQAKARAEKAAYDALAPVRNLQEFEVRNALSKRINVGDVITMAELQPYVEQGIFTPAQAQGFIDRADARREQLLKERLKREQEKGAHRKYGTWKASVNMPGGPTSMAKAQEAFDNDIQANLIAMHRAIRGGQAGNHAPITPNMVDVAAEGADFAQYLSPEFLSRPEGADAAALVFDMSAHEDFAYTPLKGYLNGVSAASPGGAVQRLDMYERAKAAGVAHLYTSDETAALYEGLLAQRRAGATDEQLTQAVPRVHDPATQTYVRDSLPQVMDLTTRFDVDVTNRFFDADVSELGNQGYVTAKRRQLARNYLAQGLSPQEAAEKVEQRFNDTHYAVAIGGRTVLLPEDGEIPSPRVATALEYLESGLPALAKAEGLPEGELRLRAEAGISGRGLTFVIEDTSGNTHSPSMTLPELVNWAQKDAREATWNKLFEKHSKAQERRSFMRRERDNPRFNPSLKGHGM